jgi:hypothetical protein
MGKLVPYIRNVDGSIVRIPDGIYQSSSKLMAPYLFEEKLIGWPEYMVYWAKESGPCVGIAPSTANLSSLSNIVEPDIK